MCKNKSQREIDFISMLDKILDEFELPAIKKFFDDRDPKSKEIILLKQRFELLAQKLYERGVYDNVKPSTAKAQGPQGAV